MLKASLLSSSYDVADELIMLCIRDSSNRTAEKAQKLVERGARLAPSPKEVAQNSDVVFTMVGFPHDGLHPFSLERLWSAFFFR